MSEFISVYITVASMPEAEGIARALVEEKLAACVNLLPGVKSVYRWQGTIEAGDEVVLIAKSRRALFPQIETAVKRLSSYTCPCIVAWPMVDAHKPYLEWIDAETE